MQHHRLQCYRVLVTFAQGVPALLAKISPGHHDLVDQFRRALASAVLNLAEGNGRRSPKERARFFDIAVASLAEVDATIELFRAYGWVSATDAKRLQAILRLASVQIRHLPSSFPLSS